MYKEWRCNNLLPFVVALVLLTTTSKHNTMKRKVYKHKDEVFATVADLARSLGIAPTSLRSYISNNNLTSGTFEYRGYSITILN